MVVTSLGRTVLGVSKYSLIINETALTGRSTVMGTFVVLSTELINVNWLPERVSKLTFRALAFRQTEVMGGLPK